MSTTTISPYAMRVAQIIDSVLLAKDGDTKGRRSNAIHALGEVLEACEYVDHAIGNICDVGDCDEGQPDETIVEVRMTMAGVRQLRDAVSFMRGCNR